MSYYNYKQLEDFNRDYFIIYCDNKCKYCVYYSYVLDDCKIKMRLRNKKNISDLIYEYLSEVNEL